MIGVLEEGRNCVAIEEDPILYIQSKVYALNALDTDEEATTCGTPSTHTDVEPEELPSEREGSPSILDDLHQSEQ